MSRSVETIRDPAVADLAARTLAEIDDAKSDPAPAPEERRHGFRRLMQGADSSAGIVKTLEADEMAPRRSPTKAFNLALRPSPGRGAVGKKLPPHWRRTIPGEILGGARADQSTACVFGACDEWTQPLVDGDMSITAGGRPYAPLGVREMAWTR